MEIKKPLRLSALVHKTKLLTTRLSTFVVKQVTFFYNAWIILHSQTYYENYCKNKCSLIDYAAMTTFQHCHYSEFFSYTCPTGTTRGQCRSANDKSYHLKMFCN